MAISINIHSINGEITLNRATQSIIVDKAQIIVNEVDGDDARVMVSFDKLEPAKIEVSGSANADTVRSKLHRAIEELGFAL